MFIRRTQTNSTSARESYYTYRLVRSERIGKKVKQLTLMNLGRHFDVDKDHWEILCARIEELLTGQTCLVPLGCTAKTERNAQRIAAQLIARGLGLNSETTQKTDSTSTTSTKDTSSSNDSTPSNGDMQTVDIDSLEMTRPRSVGVEAAGLWAMQQVDFDGLLKDLNFSGRQRAAVMGSILGRMAAPASELATYEWLTQRSGLGDLLDVDFEAMGLSALYRASDRLLAAQNAIESQLFNRLADLFGLSATVTLYDLTNTYFEGGMADNLQAKRGRSKEKRSDCPLVTLGMVLDGSGFVRRSEVFEGNVSEGKTLEGMLTDLETPSGALVVMDRGIATEDNLVWLREQGYRYLVVSRERHRQFDADNAMRITTASGEHLQLEKTLSEDGKEVRLYCYSEQRDHKESAMQAGFSKRFEAGLDKLAEGLSKPRSTKKLDKVWERIGRLKASAKGVAQHYEIHVKPDEKGINAVAVTYVRKPLDGTSATHPGVYCLRSSEIDWDEEKLWRTYTMLTDLEAVFRSLKSELGLRPIYHHKKERTEGHLFITVLAYQFVQIIRRQLKDKGVNASWTRIRQWMSTQMRITSTFKRADGQALHVRKATKPEGEHLNICELLGIEKTPGKIEKLIYGDKN